MLRSFTDPPRELTAVVIGASGGIGGAMVELLAGSDNITKVHAFSRSFAAFASPKVISGKLDLADERTIETAARTVERADIILLATGILHGTNSNGQEFGPEKNLKQIASSSMEHVFAANTIGPALVMKHFLPLLPRHGKSAFAALVARVGSISDNELGGWYAYRASKAALMMLIRTASIELARQKKDALCVGLHPGTVETGLSAPFKNNPHDRFSPEKSAGYLLDVLDGLDSSATGKQFDWRGEEVPA